MVNTIGQSMKQVPQFVYISISLTEVGIIFASRCRSYRYITILVFWCVDSWVATSGNVICFQCLCISISSYYLSAHSIQSLAHVLRLMLTQTCPYAVIQYMAVSKSVVALFANSSSFLMRTCLLYSTKQSSVPPFHTDGFVRIFWLFIASRRCLWLICRC